MPRRHSNVTKVTRSNKGVPYVLFRARLTFPFDSELGYKPPAKDFYADTMAEAIKKRAAYRPDSDALDKKTPFLEYIRDTFIPIQSEAKDVSWSHIYDRKNRLFKYFISPADSSVAKTAIRKVRIGLLTPPMMEEYFRALERAGVSAENRRKLRADLRAGLLELKRKLPHSVDSYFLEIKTPESVRGQRKVFDPELILSVIRDESKPVEDRALVAFQFIMQCRPSEMWALQWADLSLHEGTVNFSKAVRKTKGQYAVLKGSKTGQKGVRTAAMGEFLSDLLRRVQKARMADNTLTEWVFQTHTGRQVHKDRFDRLWDSVRISLGLPKGPSFYSLKHLGNSYALSHGVSPSAQADKMGHASTRMAMREYRTILNAEKRSTAAVFDDTLKSAAVTKAETGEV